MFIDFHYDKPQSKWCREEQTQATTAIPSLRRPAEVRKFIEKYKELLERTDMFNKVEDIKKQFAEASDTEQIFLVAWLNKYDAVWVQLAKSAIKTLKSKITGTRDWSPTFALKGAICRYWNQRMHIFYTTGKLSPREVFIAAKFIHLQ